MLLYDLFVCFLFTVFAFFEIAVPLLQRVGGASSSSSWLLFLLPTSFQQKKTKIGLVWFDFVVDGVAETNCKKKGVLPASVISSVCDNKAISERRNGVGVCHLCS